MPLRHLPLRRPQPDSERFIDVLMGRADGSAPPLVEYIVDELVVRQIVEGLLERQWASPVADRESERHYWDNLIDFWYRMGYDFIKVEVALPFPEKRLLAPDTAPGSSRDRAWADEHQGAIASWEDFERYPWPSIEELDLFALEYIDTHLPDGMGLVSSHAGGIYEHLSWIMSYEGVCLALHDDPALVRAVSDRVGQLMLGYYERLLELDRLIAVFPGDDMGFRTGTLVAPDALREYCLPWHKRFASMTHANGLPYFLHSCGNVEAIMEDLISDVGIDGKHSFEDVIIPVEDFQEQYGTRIAVLGGIDVDILGRFSADDVRRKTRQVIEACGPRGRYAVGSGNSIPSYVPAPNYLAMLDEALDVAAGT